MDIEINGEPVQLQMKLGDNGEAFFVQETTNNKVISGFVSELLSMYFQKKTGARLLKFYLKNVCCQQGKNA